VQALQSVSESDVHLLLAYVSAVQTVQSEQTVSSNWPQEALANFFSDMSQLLHAEHFAFLSTAPLSPMYCPISQSWGVVRGLHTVSAEWLQASNTYSVLGLHTVQLEHFVFSLSLHASET
jgi:hypothetical protein